MRRSTWRHITHNGYMRHSNPFRKKKEKRAKTRRENELNWRQKEERKKRMGMLELSSVEKFISEILSFSLWRFLNIFSCFRIDSHYKFLRVLSEAQKSTAHLEIRRMNNTFNDFSPFPLSLHTVSTSSMKLITKILRMLSIAQSVECVRWLIALMMIEWSGTEHKQKHTRMKQKSWSENFSLPHTKKTNKKKTKRKWRRWKFVIRKQFHSAPQAQISSGQRVRWWGGKVVSCRVSLI